MKLRVTLQTEGTEIPMNHIYQLQSAVLRILPEEINKRIHDEGIKSRISQKIFRPYNLSRLLFGKKEIKKESIIPKGDIHFYISSHDEGLINVIANSLVKDGNLTLGQENFEVKAIEVMDLNTPGTEFIVKTVSPIIVMDRFKDDSGRYKTRFYSPDEEVFARKIEQNLREKFSAISDAPLEEIEKMTFRISAKKVRKEVVKYKDMFLTGYSGWFSVKGDPLLIKTAYDLGLGNRSAYSGCILI